MNKYAENNDAFRRCRYSISDLPDSTSDAYANSRLPVRTRVTREYNER